jgi:hypothetical protein
MFICAFKAFLPFFTIFFLWLNFGGRIFTSVTFHRKFNNVKHLRRISKRTFGSWTLPKWCEPDPARKPKRSGARSLIRLLARKTRPGIRSGSGVQVRQAKRPKIWSAAQKVRNLDRPKATR